MARIRTFKPDIMRHALLIRLWRETGLPVLPVYMGLWNHADREGRFRLNPDQHALDILPGLGFDMVATLQLLVDHRFIVPYAVGGKAYAYIPTWKEHQWITDAKERAVHPAPPPPAVIGSEPNAPIEGTPAPILGKGAPNLVQNYRTDPAILSPHEVSLDDLSPLFPGGPLVIAALGQRVGREGKGREVREIPDGISLTARETRFDWRDRMAPLKGWRSIFTEEEAGDLWWLDRVRDLRNEALRGVHGAVQEGSPKVFGTHFQRICRSGLASAPELYCAFRLYLQHQKQAGWAQQGKVSGLEVFFGTGERATSPWEGWVERARPRLEFFLGVLRKELGPLPGDDAPPPLPLDLAVGAEGPAGPTPTPPAAPGPSQAPAPAPPAAGVPPLVGLTGAMPGLEDLLRRS